MNRHLLRSLVVVMGLAVSPLGAVILEGRVVEQTAPAAVRVTAERANVREAASPTATIVGTVDRGTQLPVLGVSGTWYRVRVQPSNREGFIAMSTVEAVAAGAPTTTAPAQPTPQPTPAPAPRPATPQPAAPRPATQPRAASATPWHVRGFIGGDGFGASATETFTALLGEPNFSGQTFGADVYGGMLPFGLFARVGVSKFSADGERVFVINGQTFGTGIPLTVKMTPIQIGAGIRRTLGQPTAARPTFASRLTPYAGVGLVLLTYQEISEFADDGDNDAEKFKGLSVFGGLDVNIWKYVSAGIEAELRQVSGFGTAGISQEFGEDQLGGLSIKFLIGIGK